MQAVMGICFHCLMLDRTILTEKLGKLGKLVIEKIRVGSRKLVPFCRGFAANIGFLPLLFLL